MIDTVAWEAYRESFDDVRYLTLLRRLAHVAIRSGNRGLHRLGTSAIAWAELIDSEQIEFDELLDGASRWINQLRSGLADASVAVSPQVYE